ncbi:hypothetical protein [Streptomyces sp. NPDC059979]|uniref:hypothetical protein n=1 Tax=Streptomyces sp. NPDC059979 TaxID=3347021 RepID=UPI003675666E
MIPSPAQLRDIRTAGDDRLLLVVGDAYRITEQVNQITKTYGRLKHREPTDYRDVPCLRTPPTKEVAHVFDICAGEITIPILRTRQQGVS